MNHCLQPTTASNCHVVSRVPYSLKVQDHPRSRDFDFRDSSLSQFQLLCLVMALSNFRNFSWTVSRALAPGMCGVDEFRQKRPDDVSIGEGVFRINGHSVLPLVIRKLFF